MQNVWPLFAPQHALLSVRARVFAAPSHDDGLQRVPGSYTVAQRNSAHHCFSRMKHWHGHACAPARGRSPLAAAAQTLQPDRQQISDPE